MYKESGDTLGRKSYTCASPEFRSEFPDLAVLSVESFIKANFCDKIKSNVFSSKFENINDYGSGTVRLKQTMRLKRALTCIFSCCRRAAFCISNCLIKLTIFPFNSLIAESFSLQSTSLPRNWHLQKSDKGVQ